MSISTLRVKLTLALLFTGLASAVLVGVIARTIVLQRVETRSRDEIGMMAQAQVFNRMSEDLADSHEICDIDHFKRINDTFSHATGDVARYGGEEFVAVFPQTSLNDAAAMCERIRKEVESFAWKQIHPNLTVTLSMGLDADLTRNSIEEMLQIANTWLYAAKQSGRNRLVIQPVA